MFSPDPQHPGQLRFGKAFQRHVESCPEAPCLSRDALVLALKDQRAAGIQANPTFSSAAIDIDFDNLSEAGVTHVTIKVKK